MNGLCEHCQVYYPMPPDFAEGAAYTCPECGTGLVPYEAPEAQAPPPEPPGDPLGHRSVDWEPLDPTLSPGGEPLDDPAHPGEDPLDPSAPDRTAPQAPEAPTLELEVDLVEAPHPWATLPPEVAVPGTVGPVGVVRYRRAPGPPAHPASATRFVHRGAGEGVAVEEVPPGVGRARDPGWEFALGSARREAPGARGWVWGGLGLLLVAGVALLLTRGGPALEGPAATPATDASPPAAAEGAPEPPGTAPAVAEPDPTPPEQAAREAGPQEIRARSLARVRIGNAHLTAGRVDAAIQAFEQALLLDEDNGFAHRGLGIAYARLGRAAEAAQEYTLYLRLVPDAPDAEEAREYVERYQARRRR